MNSIERLLKEWSIILDYLCSTSKVSIKSLCKANNLNYMRCIKINKLLHKKEDKIAYARQKVEHYKAELESTKESLPPLEEVEAELLPTLESHTNIFTFTQPNETITKYEFKNYKEYMQLQIDELVVAEKNNYLFLTGMIIANMICGFVYVLILQG